MELEERYHIDIEELKLNLLSESERILVLFHPTQQKQMTEQAHYYESQISAKDSQIHQLTQRLQLSDQQVH